MICQRKAGTSPAFFVVRRQSELASTEEYGDAPILYWGDIDTWGFGILAALRRYHPATRSCLMDEATLRSHLHLQSTEKTPSGPRSEGLTAAECALLDKLVSGEPWGVGVRIEQERLDWATAWADLSAVGPSATGAWCCLGKNFVPLPGEPLSSRPPSNEKSGAAQGRMRRGRDTAGASLEIQA